MATVEINGTEYPTRLITWAEGIRLQEIKNETDMGAELVRLALGGKLSTAEINDLPLKTMVGVIEIVTTENGMADG